MAFNDLFKLFRVGRSHEGMAHHGTKKGPGRRNAQRAVGPKRLETRTQGGNWQGLNYLSYQDHDYCVRNSMGVRHAHSRREKYNALRDTLVQVRTGTLPMYNDESFVDA